jgi:hypothetical protein
MVIDEMKLNYCMLQEKVDRIDSLLKVHKSQIYENSADKESFMQKLKNFHT